MASLNDTAARHTPDSELGANRKLIRPSLADVRGQLARSAAPAGHGPAGPGSAGLGPRLPGAASAAANAPVLPRLPKKPVPPEVTNAESFYFLKQMQSKTEMVLVLNDGERVRGVIEWYDRHCIKMHRSGEPNLLIYKAIIKYMYKAEDEGRA